MNSVSHFFLQCKLLAVRIGVIRPVALLCVVVALVIHYWAVPQVKHQLVDIESALKDTSIPTQNMTPHVSDSRRLKAFHDIQLDRANLPETLKTIFSLADENGLQLGHGEYRLEANADGGFALYQASLPINGSYPQIRHFIQGVLAALPGCALQEVTLSREHIGATALEAKLRFSILVRV